MICFAAYVHAKNYSCDPLKEGMGVKQKIAKYTQTRTHIVRGNEYWLAKRHGNGTKGVVSGRSLNSLSRRFMRYLTSHEFPPCHSTVYSSLSKDITVV